MKTNQHDEVVQQTEQQRIECAIDTALLNADLLREQVAELEAELAELRKRVCVPEGYVVVPVEPTESMMRVARGLTMQEEQAPGCEYRKLVQAAPAPVERNQCDGCQAGIPVENGMHRMGKPGGYVGLMACTAGRYGSAPVERVELMTWPQAVDRAARLIDEEQERLTAEGYFMDSDDCCDVLRESVGTPQSVLTTAQDVAGLVEALERALDFIRGDGDFEHREALERCECYACVTGEIIDSLATHQQREGEL